MVKSGAWSVERVARPQLLPPGGTAATAPHALPLERITKIPRTSIIPPTMRFCALQETNTEATDRISFSRTGPWVKREQTEIYHANCKIPLNRRAASFQWTHVEAGKVDISVAGRCGHRKSCTNGLSVCSRPADDGGQCLSPNAHPWIGNLVPSFL